MSALRSAFEDRRVERDVVMSRSDFVYMVPPFIAYYGALQSDKDLLLEAYNQCRLYRDALQDPSPQLGIPTWKHIVQGSFQDNTHWATGNGWAAAGMMRVLATFNHSSFGSELRKEQANLVDWIDEILVTSWKYQVGAHLAYFSYPFKLR